MSEVSIAKPLMHRAFQLAKFAVGFSDPNPAVGAILVSPSGKIIGEGFTDQKGGDHAEIMAIKNALSTHGPNFVIGSSLYVTLEPCCHFGSTPPCTQAIISNRIKKVIIAAKDQSPEVNGNGIKILKKNGIHVHLMSSHEYSLEKYLTLEPFFHKKQTNLPRLILKWAQTKEGWLSPLKGESGKITSKPSLELLHRMRQIFRATITTPGTILTDRPALDNRIEKNELSLFSKIKKNSYLISLLKRIEISYPTIHADILERIFHEKNHRYFIIPDLSENWKESQLDDFIQKQKDIGDKFCIFTYSKNLIRLLQSNDINFFYIKNKMDFSSVLKKIAFDGHNQILAETGPIYAQFLMDHFLPDALICFQSNRPSRWKGEGRYFSMSNAIANGEDSFIKEKGYEKIEQFGLEQEDCSFYRLRSMNKNSI